MNNYTFKDYLAKGNFNITSDFFSYIVRTRLVDNIGLD
jgi:hypothetical protein